MRRTQWAAIALLTVALIACASAQTPTPAPGGKKPERPAPNKANPPPGAAPPPLKENKKPGDAREGPPKVDRNGTKEDKKYVMSAGGFNVEVNGGGNKPPFFRFWSDVANMQRIELRRMFQTSTPNNISASRPTKMVDIIGAYKWAFSDATSSVDAVTNTSDVSFTMTGTPKETANADRPAPNLQLICHLLSSANGTEFKYDLKISNFDDSWWDASATALAIGYRISTMEPDGEKEKGNMTLSDVRIQLDAKRPVKPKKADGTNGGVEPRMAMDFGNGNGIEVVSTAVEDGGASKAVVMTAIQDKNEGSFVLTIYERFSKGLTHDPTMYTAATSSTLDASANEIITFGEPPAACLMECAAPQPETQPVLGGGASSVAASSLCSFIVLSALAIVSFF